MKNRWNKLSKIQQIWIFIILFLSLSIILVLGVDIGIYLVNGKLIVGTDGDWISFWGSFLGALVSVAGAVCISYWTTKKQLEESKKNDFENQIKLADLTRLSEALVVLRKCDNGLSQLEEAVKKHDFHVSLETLDLQYDDDTSANYLKWISEDGKKIGALMDDFLLEFSSIVRGLDRNNTTLLEEKIDILKEDYLDLQKDWNRKFSLYSEVTEVFESFLKLKNTFDTINNETISLYTNIRNKDS